MARATEFSISARYPVLEKAREITQQPNRDILEVRKFLGVPLAADIRLWLPEQLAGRLLVLDFRGVRAVTLSVAEELGPLLMQAIAQNPALEHRYVAYQLDSTDTLYTFAQAFAAFNWAALAIEPKGAIEATPSAFPVAQAGDQIAAILGQLSEQMKRILGLAEQHWRSEKPLTSDSLAKLDFMKEVGAAARSKRLTELHARRLLAFRENPDNPRERLFTPPWRL
jgi:hypothetical protein